MQSENNVNIIDKRFNTLLPTGSDAEQTRNLKYKSVKHRKSFKYCVIMMSFVKYVYITYKKKKISLVSF